MARHVNLIMLCQVFNDLSEEEVQPGLDLESDMKIDLRQDAGYDLLDFVGQLIRLFHNVKVQQPVMVGSLRLALEYRVDDLGFYICLKIGT